ncbi:MAG: DUF6988 family protein [Lysobacter sp.]
MNSEQKRDFGSLDLFTTTLDRSLALEALVYAAWEPLELDDEASARAAAGLCTFTLDHGQGLRTLLPSVPPSAIALLRLQYETLVRAVWAQHAANERDLSRLFAPLTSQSQQAAKQLPGVPEMLVAIEKAGPTGAAALLGRTRSRLWDGLNSFIHGGIHPFQRGEEGYPVTLLIDVLKNANAMSMLTLLVLAEITDDVDVMVLVSGLHEEFQDVLPALEPYIG